MTFLARGVCGNLPIVTISGPLCTSFSTSRRILRKSTSRFLSTFAATPLPSLTKPRRTCSVPMYSWLNRCASWFASCMTFRARSVNRSYIFFYLDEIECASTTPYAASENPSDRFLGPSKSIRFSFSRSNLVSSSHWCESSRRSKYLRVRRANSTRCVRR